MKVTFIFGPLIITIGLVKALAIKVSFTGEFVGLSVFTLVVRTTGTPVKVSFEVGTVAIVMIEIRLAYAKAHLVQAKGSLSFLV